MRALCLLLWLAGLLWCARPEPHCTRALYESLKGRLLARHSGNVWALFAHLDANWDQQLSARELWPLDTAGGERNDDGHARYQFPFEPLEPDNPCALSHLLVFEPLSSGRAISAHEFARAFGQSIGPKPQPRLVSLSLGEQVELECGPAKRCAWWRHGVPLDSNQPHLRLLQLWNNASQSSQLNLQLSEAQLHLSGPYLCSCASHQPNEAPLEQLFIVQVQALPLVELRPLRQWALVGSRISFECQYDWIDTRIEEQTFPAALRCASAAQFGLQLVWSHKSSQDVESNCLFHRPRISLSMAASRLSLDRLEVNDSGIYTCRLELGAQSSEGHARLQVQERPELSITPLIGQAERRHLWIFHEDGASLFRLMGDEGARLELVRELRANEPLLRGRWHWLSLCGGLNADQAVICEWSDNALIIGPRQGLSSGQLVYVGQPNLDRVLVLDGLTGEMLSVINTAPQPRLLFLHRPTKMRLDSRIRRRWAANRNSSVAPSQHDIWLLCYGQPLLLNPNGSLLEEAEQDGLSSGSESSKHSPLGSALSLRARKSIHVIRSTFLAGTARSDVQTGGPFARNSLLTSHRLLAPKLGSNLAGSIQELFIAEPSRALQAQAKHQSHPAFLSVHRRPSLFKVSTDNFRPEAEIDLLSCDPTHLVASAQGLLVVQCREPASQNLSGQLVLDQLSQARLQYNRELKASQTHLSPDHKYLVSLLGQQSAALNQSIIYVQSVNPMGLKLDYEIKSSSLDISECAFVWKDGYYVAILVSVNKRDQQTEVLSLRLVDGRLQLIARLPGLVTSSQHRRQLLVADQLKLAALSTNQATYLLDLEDNRVSQTLRRHKSPPTLLWL